MAHVGGDFLYDTLPLPLWYFDAADRCNNLDKGSITLAAALLTSLSASIMAVSTISLMEDLLATDTRSHRNAYSIWIGKDVLSA